MPLTALKVRSARSGRHTDAHGLYLFVRESGSRSWVLRMQHRGKRRDFGLGPAQDVTLAEARTLASDLRRMVRSGVDPAAQRKLRKKAAPSFNSVARDCYGAMKGGWKNQRHESWLSSLENHVFPQIGAKPINEIDGSAVLEVLEPIWLTIPDTARRILQRIGTVLDYAHIKGLIPGEVSLRSVTRGLPRQVKQVTHREAMPYAEVPGFMAALVALPNTTGRDALKLTVLTAVRSNETRFATWGEIDLEAGVWSIPAARMKMREPHLVPLSAPALILLKRLQGECLVIEGVVKPDRLVFTTSGSKPISDMTMLKVLRDMQHSSITVHGFRSSFTDWAAECTDTPKEIVDKALAHRIANAVEAAYRRTDFFDKRRTLMSRWAAHLMGSGDE